MISSPQKILKKILKPRRNWLQTFLGSVGFGLGIIFLLLSLQLYLSIIDFFSPHQKTKNNYIVLSKPINMLGAFLRNATTGFSDGELEEIKKQPFVADIGVFTPNQFGVVAYIESLGFYTEMFFEALPTQFLDEKPANFEWKEGDQLIPIILSQDMLDLYNFGFAMGKNGQLPQITPATVGLVTLGIKLTGTKKEKKMTAKIVGFSQRYATILVPQNFMNWANENLSNQKPKNPSRIVLKLNNANSPEVAKYIQKNNYQINKDKLLASQTADIVLQIMSAVAILGSFFVILSVVVFLMSMRLILAEAKNEIKLLLEIGYAPQKLFNFLIKYFGFNVLILLALSTTSVYFLYQFIQNYLEKTGLDLDKNLKFEVIISAFILCIFTLLLQAFWLKKWINKEN
ncbi:MAG: FtsX-like permease family protein [Bacteroidetes bacterium]|nr:MAG: FtsX-like permease family protein [Bacteroidota bacterium]TAG86822.1 MAG: FtsX-like permease family protein [Bacteroidota bacterium]